MGRLWTKATRSQDRAQMQLGRRSNPRFPIQMQVSYWPLDGEFLGEMGSGRTLDISRAGIAYTTEHSLPPGLSVELWLDWPVLLNECCALRLLVRGTILRVSGNVAVIKIDTYEFRTRRFSPGDAPTAFGKRHYLPGQDPGFGTATPPAARSGQNVPILSLETA
jgi:hypothetical protein